MTKPSTMVEAAHNAPSHPAVAVRGLSGDDAQLQDHEGIRATNTAKSQVHNELFNYIDRYDNLDPRFSIGLAGTPDRTPRNATAVVQEASPHTAPPQVGRRSERHLQSAHENA